MASDTKLDQARLRALHQSGLLTAHSLPSFDNITDLVRDMLDVPVAVFSVVSDDRQVFVGSRGLSGAWAEKGATPLTHSFCKHVVERSAPLAVVDARLDPALRENRAIEELGVVAYLGVPLALPTGEVVGALAAISAEPRAWSAGDLRRLEKIAKVAADEIEARVSESKWRTLFAEMQEGLFIGEAIRDESGRMVDWRFFDVNPAFERLTGLAAETAEGRTWREIIPDGNAEIVAHYARAIESGEALVFELKIAALAGIWLEIRARALGNERFVSTFTDITARRERELRLAELEERRRLAADVGEVGLWDLDIAARALVLDRRMLEMNGVSADGSLDMAGAFAAIHPDDRDRVERDLGQLATSAGEDLELIYRTVGIEDGIVRTIQVNARSVADPAGGPARLTGAARDISERVAGDERRKLLNEELAHRLKNALAIVSSIITQTFRTASDLESARRALSARILALSRAHDILLTGQRDAASVGNVVSSAIALHDEGQRVVLNGPNLLMGPKASLTLALIVHELATNAGKYGALSVPAGVVDVRWSVSRDAQSGIPVLVIDWTERGGPVVTEPKRKGFGTRLIEMGLSGSVGGTSAIRYEPGGLACRIVAPLVELMTESEAEE